MVQMLLTLTGSSSGIRLMGHHYFRFVRAAFIVIASSMPLGCSNEYPLTQVPAIPGPDADPTLYQASLEPDYVISPGDALLVNSYYEPTLKQQVIVQPDGRVSLLLVSEVMAAGKTVPRLRQELANSYGKLLNGADVSVAVTDIASQTVFIGGEVKQPSMQSARGQLTLLEAIDAAGGFTPGANQQQVLILRAGPDGHFKAVQQNVAAVLHNEAGEIYLHRHDIVYVPKSQIARVDQFIDQYVNQIIPHATSAVFGYQFVNQTNAGSSTVILPH